MSSADQFEQAMEMIIDNATIVIDPDETPAPFEASTGEKPKRFRSGTSTPTDRDKDDSGYISSDEPRKTHTPNHSFHKEDIEHMELQLACTKNENAKLRKEKDELTAQKESLEKLLLNMASEMTRLSEMNSKLKEDYARVQEEKERSITREEFTRLETQVSKLREEFEKERRGFSATVAMVLGQIHKNR
ncbi:hypothetical protein SAY87_016595 [Trapa incisa]|uniref:Uncharacterized protein n=1 Tax=Trapa incisa TaxID=236973 RepID=A0AAN7L9J0_9MYRT|nr:hypothetical protein SAY87_016595 [Trapa incisa]